MTSNYLQVSKKSQFVYYYLSKDVSE